LRFPITEDPHVVGKNEKHKPIFCRLSVDFSSQERNTWKNNRKIQLSE